MNNNTSERFFFIMGLVLLAMVIAGFGSATLTRPGGIASMPLILHVHGAVFLSWFVLFCTQAKLAGSGNIELHMRLGKASVVLAVTMIVLGYFVTKGAYARPDWSIGGMSGAASVMFPFTDIVNFIIAYSLALANRRHAAIHKRFMLLAGILIIDPAVARFIFTTGLPFPLIILGEFALFAALFVYDFRTRGRPSWPSSLGLGLFLAALAAKLTIAQQPAWQSFVDMLFG